MTDERRLTSIEPEEKGESEHKTRRQMIGAGSAAAMGAGLLASYGALGAIAGRFLYPSNSGDGRWMFVTELDRLAAGDSLVYRSPSGSTINITRTATMGQASDFVALSSVCPHLGCQVHWEAQNERYFCPCHNGVFDPGGVGISGPPGDAGQSLSRYEVAVDGAMLFLRLEGFEAVEASADGGVIEPRPSRAGHDPCLAPREDPRKERA